MYLRVKDKSHVSRDTHDLRCQRDETESIVTHVSPASTLLFLKRLELLQGRDCEVKQYYLLYLSIREKIFVGMYVFIHIVWVWGKIKDMFHHNLDH